MDDEIHRVPRQRFELLERIYRASLNAPRPLDMVETPPIASEMGIDGNTLQRLLGDLEQAGDIRFVSDGGEVSAILSSGKSKVEAFYNHFGALTMLLNKHNATVTLVKKDGRRIEGIPAHVQPKMILIDDATVPVEEDDCIERHLPSKLTERFYVIDRGFYHATGHFPDHYQIKVRKMASVPISAVPSTTHNTTYNVSGDNARVTHGSDTSTNVTIDNSSHQFTAWRKTVQESVPDSVDRDLILKRLDDLEMQKDKKGALETLGSIASVATKYAPLIPLIAKIGAWVHGLPA